MPTSQPCHLRNDLATLSTEPRARKCYCCHSACQEPSWSCRAVLETRRAFCLFAAFSCTTLGTVRPGTQPPEPTLLLLIPELSPLPPSPITTSSAKCHHRERPAWDLRAAEDRTPRPASKEPQAVAFCVRQHCTVGKSKKTPRRFGRRHRFFSKAKRDQTPHAGGAVLPASYPFHHQVCFCFVSIHDRDW